jgi:hypothetical protein
MKLPQTYTERRKLREQLQRESYQGVNIDAAVKCVCQKCGQVHYRKREAEKK